LNPKKRIGKKGLLGKGVKKGPKKEGRITPKRKKGEILPPTREFCGN